METNGIKVITVAMFVAIFSSASPSMAGSDPFGYNFEHKVWKKHAECMFENWVETGHYGSFDCSASWDKEAQKKSASATFYAEKAVYVTIDGGFSRVSPKRVIKKAFALGDVSNRLGELGLARLRQALADKVQVDIETALKFIGYKKELKPVAAKLIFEAGVEAKYPLFQKWCFDKAVLISQSAGAEVSRWYIEKADVEAEPLRRISFLDMAGKASDAFHEEIGDKIAKLVPDLEGADRKFALDNLAMYWGSERVEEEIPPDYKIYPPGEYTFTLQAGETLDHWIMIPPGKHSLSLSSEDYEYVVIYFDGFEIRDGPNVIYPKRVRYKVKIRALEQQELVKLVVN